MKLRYMFLFLVALVLAPVTTSHATETTQGGEEYNPDAPGNFNDWQIDPKNELLEFDGQGRVRSGVVYITYHDGANITMYVFNLTADNGGFLYISKYGSNSDYKILSRDSEGVFSGSTYSGTMTCCRCSGVMPGSEDEKSCYHIDENTDFSLFAWYHVYDLEKDSVRSTYLPTTTPASGREVYSFYTNIPIFTDPNSDELTNYVENGDYSGASNASDVDEAKKAIYPYNQPPH